MQLVILLAFAVVLMPMSTPPWPVLRGPAAALGVVCGLSAAVLLWAGWATRRVLRYLDDDPARPSRAQRQHARDGVTLSSLLLLTFAAGTWGTEWPLLVCRVWHLQKVYGLDEFVILLPLFATLIAAWAIMYPADRAIRQVTMEASLLEGLPARPPWTFTAYMVFLLRHQLLLVALPMMAIVITNDIVKDHMRYLRKLTPLPWADQAVLVLVAGVILFFAPLLLRLIWHTSALPNGSLRDRLRRVSARLGIRYRDILVWHSEGMVVNAAVMGVLPRVRYVLLSDGLLEHMDDEKIEAVFGHEAGHVKHLHIPFYLLFATLSMLVVGGVCEVFFGRLWPGHKPLLDVSYATPTAVVLVTAAWGLGFGWISRRFERQADLFGARTVTPTADGCDLPCRVHHPPAAPANGADGPAMPAKTPSPPYALCAKGAQTFADALRRIAQLNGIPEDTRSWRHSSIGGRIRFLHELAERPERVRRFGNTIVAIKILLAVGSAVGTALAVWLYYDYL